MCRVVDTVLIDQETVYAPRQGNDRLLLGLKGSLKEYELDLLRQRSLSARYEKARRGELVVAAPRSSSRIRSSSRRTAELPTTGSSEPTAAAPPCAIKRRHRWRRFGATPCRRATEETDFWLAIKLA